MAAATAAADAAAAATQAARNGAGAAAFVAERKGIVVLDLEHVVMPVNKVEALGLFNVNVAAQGVSLNKLHRAVHLGLTLASS